MNQDTTNDAVRTIVICTRLFVRIGSTLLPGRACSRLLCKAVCIIFAGMLLYLPGQIVQAAPSPPVPQLPRLDEKADSSPGDLFMDPAPEQQDLPRLMPDPFVTQAGTPDQDTEKHATEAVYQVQDYEVLGASADWALIRSRRQRLCAVYSFPQSSRVFYNAAKIKRREHNAYINWNDYAITTENGELSFLMGRELARGAHSGHQLVVDGRQVFNLIGISDRLYVHPDHDRSAIAAIRRGRVMEVWGVGEDGLVMYDSYSLTGVQKITQMAQDDCQFASDSLLPENFFQEVFADGEKVKKRANK